MTPAMQRVAALVLVALAATAATAAAQPRKEPAPTAATLYVQGEAEFKAGNIDAAIELFSRGYALEPRAEFLLNLAQCYRALGRRAEAINHFERFIKAAPEHALRPGAERTLEELRQAEAIERVALTPRPLLPPPSQAPQLPPPRVERAPSRTWLWVTAGAVVVLGGSAALYIATRAPGVDDTIRLPPP